MKFSIKSLLMTTAILALMCAVAVVSYRRGRQDERDATFTGDWTRDELYPSTPEATLGSDSGNWVIEN